MKCKARRCGHAKPAKADRIDIVHLGFHSRNQRKRRNVSAHATHGTNHRGLAYSYELMNADHPTQVRIVFDRNVAGYTDVVRKRHKILQRNVMPEMAVSHDVAIVPHSG